MVSKRGQGTSLDIVDLDVLASGAAGTLIFRVAILVELKAAVAVVVGAKSVGLVDLGVVGKFTVCLAVWVSVKKLCRVSRENPRGNVQRTGLVGGVLQDNIALLVLVLAEGDKDDVSVVDPDLFPELSADQAEALDAIEALIRVLVGCCVCLATKKMVSRQRKG